MSSETRRLRTSSAGDEDAFIDECARPLCRNEFRRVVTAGRPQEYCDEFCRRQAGKELRRLKAKLSRYEALAQQTRIDVAAHGRASDRDGEHASTPANQRTAEDAVTKVEGILEVVGDQDAPYLRQLRALFEAVAPVVREGLRQSRSA